jgi:hypothetical protein
LCNDAAALSGSISIGPDRLGLDDLFGEMDQHPLCLMIAWFAASPLPAPFEQRLQRNESLGESSGSACPMLTASPRTKSAGCRA